VSNSCCSIGKHAFGEYTHEYINSSTEKLNRRKNRLNKLARLFNGLSLYTYRRHISHQWQKLALVDELSTPTELQNIGRAGVGVIKLFIFVADVGAK
jgi:hypothetical protein